MNQKYVFGVKVMFLNFIFSVQIFGQDRSPIFENDYNIRPISEINEQGFGDAYPWISNDGLRLYYTSQHKNDEKSDIWVSHREDIYTPFNPPQPLSVFDKNFDNLSGWLTDDELNLAYIKRRRFGQKMTALYLSHRSSKESAFGSPHIIRLDQSIKGTLISPSFTQDLSELIVYNEYKNDRFLLVFERQEGYNYKLKGTVNIPSNYIVKTGKLSSDGLMYYVSLAYKDNKPKVYILKREALHQSFHEMHLLENDVLNSESLRNHQPYFSNNGQFVVFTRSMINEWKYNEIFIGQVDDIALHKNEVIIAEEAPSHLQDISIYPNPSAHFVSISNPSSASIHVEIYNLQGQLFNTFKQDENNLQINISEYPSGSYIFKIKDPTQREQRSFKVIKVD